MEENQSIKGLTSILGVMTISIPILYLLGYFYHVGYLEKYNLSISIFGENIEGHLVNAFMFFTQAFVVVSKLIEENPYSIAIFFILIWIYGFFLVIASKKKESFAEWFQSFSNWKYFEYIFIPFVLAVASVGIPSVLLTVVASAILGVLFSFSVGNQVAQNEIDAFSSCDISRRCIVVQQDNRKKITGKIIASSNEYLALYDGVKVIVIPNEKLKFETQPKKQL